MISQGCLRRGRRMVFRLKHLFRLIIIDYTSENIIHPNDVAVSGNYAYVVNYDYNQSISRLVFMIFQSDAIVAKGYTAENLNSPRSVEISGNYAYVGNYGNSRLSVYDISNPDSITAMGYVSDNNYPYIEDIAVSGDYLYAISINYSGNSRLAVFDISSPGSISARGYIESSFKYVRKMAVSQLCLCNQLQLERRFVLAIYDASNPNSIVWGLYKCEMAFPSICRGFRRLCLCE